MKPAKIFNHRRLVSQIVVIVLACILFGGLFVRPLNNASAQSDSDIQTVTEILLEAGYQMGYSTQDEIVEPIKQDQCLGGQDRTTVIVWFVGTPTAFFGDVLSDGNMASQCLSSVLTQSNEHPQAITFHGLQALKIVRGPFQNSVTEYEYVYAWVMQNINFTCVDSDGDPPVCAEILYNVASQKLASGIPSNPQSNNNPEPGSVTISIDNEGIINQIVQQVENPVIPLAGTAIGGLIAWLVSLSRSAPIPGNTPPPSVQDGLRHPPPSVQDGLRKPALPPEKVGSVPPPLAPPPLQPATALDVLKAAYKNKTLSQLSDEKYSELVMKLSEQDTDAWQEMLKPQKAAKEGGGEFTFEGGGSKPFDENKWDKEIGVNYTVGSEEGLIHGNTVGNEYGEITADVGVYNGSIGAGYQKGKGLKVSASGEVIALQEKATAVYGDENFAGTLDGNITVGKASVGVGYEDSTLGMNVGVSLAEANLAGGVNISGVNVGVSGGVKLGLEFGFKIGKQVEVAFGPFKIGLSFGKAKTIGG